MSGSDRDVLTTVAHDALRAPSALNTQPWRWHIDDEGLDLYADRERQLRVADPDGRLLLLSCGIALHHARVSAAAAGYTPVVQRFVTRWDTDRVARVTLGARRPPERGDLALHTAMAERHTDRRPFGDTPVSIDLKATLVDAATSEGARLHLVGGDQMPMLAVAVAQAAAAEMGNAGYRNELMRWTNRPKWSSDGVPTDNAVRRVPRRVPVRELAMPPNIGIAVEPGGDRGAAYLIVYGDADGPLDWFTAGEATSAVLLTATSLGLSSAPISDVIEVQHPRDLVAGLLPAETHPYLVVRCGWSASSEKLAKTPRRDPVETIRRGDTS
jgi:hypothetical protein